MYMRPNKIVNSAGIYMQSSKKPNKIALMVQKIIQDSWQGISTSICYGNEQSLLVNKATIFLAYYLNQY